MGINSRNEILRRIKNGLRNTPTSTEAAIPAGERLDREGMTQDAARRYRELGEGRQVLVDRFVEEVIKIRGTGKIIKSESEIKEFLGDLIRERGLRCAALWESEFLRQLRIKEFLKDEGLRFASPENKGEIADADIGITEADFAVADTGTMVLMANKNQPRSVSLIPPIHVGIVKSDVIVENVYDLFLVVESSLSESGSILDLTNCMTFVTGPSRTADIELNLTLGVHGPREVFVLVYT